MKDGKNGGKRAQATGLSGPVSSAAEAAKRSPRARALQLPQGGKVKPFVMGWKNWLFANPLAGTQSRSVIYNLIETAKENDLDPYRYLVWHLLNALGLSHTVEFWAEYFLPINAPQKCRIPKSNGMTGRHLNDWALRWRPFIHPEI